MGNFNTPKRRQLKFLEAPLTEKLQRKLESVEWGKYKLEELFEIKSSKKIYHGNQLDNIYDNKVKNSFSYVVRTTQNNGVRGYIIENKNNVNEGNTLSFAQDTFSVFYQKNKYFTGNKVKVLIPKFQNRSEEIMKYLTVSFQKSLNSFTWGVGSTIETIAKTEISLPTKNGKIDFDFMGDFVEELEKEKMGILDKYLEKNDFKDFELSEEEKRVLREFESGEVEWGEYRIGDLFERLSTKKVPFKASELSIEHTNEYNLPCLTSSFKNQGLNYFVPNKDLTILKNVISIPSNSDVYRAYFQSRNFTILSDAYAIDWINKKTLNNSKYSLFSVVSINKVTDLKIYSYKNKLGGWNIVKNKLIQLPTKNGEVDYGGMEVLISAIEKMVIKKVVEYVEGKK